MDPGQKLNTVFEHPRFAYSLLLGMLDLETNDISILNLTLSKSELLFHELNHARLDFL